MPVMIECINVLVPYKKLIKVFPGGKIAFDESCLNGTGFWHDGHLVRFGAMNDIDMAMIINQFKGWGLRPRRDFGFDESWIEHSPEGFLPGCVALKGELDAPLIGPDNFDAFMRGQIKALRRRATIIVQREKKTLLVRDRGKTRYSLPGGKIERKELSLCAAIRELYEELGMRAIKAERQPERDFDGSFNKHMVCWIESNDDPVINRKELDDYLWWDGKQNIPRYDHVDKIVFSLNAGPINFSAGQS